jgi:hypothetical protein
MGLRSQSRARVLLCCVGPLAALLGPSDAAAAPKPISGKLSSRGTP